MRCCHVPLKVLTLYADVLRRDFYNHVRDESTSCVLMNNIQQTRIQLEKTYQVRFIRLL